jgi:multiple sugar transport system permease protein
MRIPAVVVTTVLLLIYAIPLLWLVMTSFKPNQSIVASPASIIFTPTVQAYVDVIQEGILLSALNTIIIGVGTTVVCLVIALPTAYALQRTRSWLVPLGLGGLIVLQIMPQTSTVIPLYRVLGTWGLLGGYPGLILADSAMLLPFTILVLLPFFGGVPLEIEEAASVDGASHIRTFLSVVLPILRNGITTMATIVFIISSGEFLYAISFLSQPLEYPLTATVAEQTSQHGVDWAALMAIAVFASIPTLIVFALGQRSLIRGLSMGAVK